MSDEKQWRWWYSDNEEGYHGPCDTREQAIQEAKDDECGLWLNTETNNWEISLYLCEAYQTPIRLETMFRVDDWFEELDEGVLEDQGNPDEGIGALSGITRDARDALQTAVRAAIAGWHEAGNTILPWAFAGSRNNENYREIIGPGPQPETPEGEPTHV